MRKVAIYGKGGIGKSTTTQNTVAGLTNGEYSPGTRHVNPRRLSDDAEAKAVGTLVSEEMLRACGGA